MWRLGVLLAFVVAIAVGYYSGLTAAQSRLVTPDEINNVEVRTRNIRGVVTIISKSAPEAVPQGEDPNIYSTGFFYSANRIITNYHAVNNDPVSVQVQLFDGRRFRAEIEAYDIGIDIAILSVQGITAPAVLRFSSSAEVLPGQKAIVLGSPQRKPNNVAVGVVSGFNRIEEFPDEIGIEIPEMMLTDANIESGNSGGPVLDSKGFVIGVVDANLESSLTATGKIGLAIPAPLVQQSISDLERFGVSQRGKLGAQLKDVSELEPFVLREVGLNSNRGALVMAIDPSSAAARAGLRASKLDRDGRISELGDVILKVGSRDVQGRYDVIQQVAKRRPGDTITLSVWRNRRPVELKFVLNRVTQ
ncbi:MAG: S1C family serine protease [Deinococcales bacterium]